MIDSSGNTQLTVPYCTENALASRYCAFTFTGAPENLGSSLYRPGGSDGYVRLSTYGDSAPGTGGYIFSCDNDVRGLAGTVEFPDLQCYLLMTPGPDDAAVEMLGAAHR